MSYGLKLTGLFAATFVAVAGLAALPTNPGAGDPQALLDEIRLTAVGDEVRVHLTFFDAEGKIMLSTDEGKAANLSEAKNQSAGEFVLPKSYKPMRYRITDGWEPTRLTDRASLLIGDSLIGKPTGSRALVPVVGSFEGYARTETVQRWQGPFDVTMHVSNELLKNLTTSENGTRIQIDSLLDAEMVQRNDTTTVVQLLLSEGSRMPVRGTEIFADVVYAEGGQQFYLRLGTEVGRTFSVLERCAFAKSLLPAGSYRVAAVNDTVIQLDASWTKFPQVMERDLSALIEIIDFKGAAAPGGET